MSSNKSKNISSFTRPLRTRKHVPCDCIGCNGKLVDPRTKAAHAKKIVMPPRGINKSTNTPPPIDLISTLEDIMDISDEEPQESHEESYSFLVRRMPITSQKKKKSEISVPEAISEVFSDDDGDGTSEEDNEEVFEDDVLEYSSDDSDEDFQVNFTAPATELVDFKSLIKDPMTLFRGLLYGS